MFAKSKLREPEYCRAGGWCESSVNWFFVFAAASSCSAMYSTTDSLKLSMWTALNCI